jgi:hypothetical protein
MTDKDAMKLALFALDIVKMHYTQSRHVNEAIAALKERLAQPEQTEVQQLIALVQAQQITIDKLEMALADPMREVQRLGQEIEQEPVAWGVFEGNLHDMFFTQEEAQEMAKLKGTHAEVRPFTAPPQRTESLIGCVNHDCAKCKGKNT